MSEEEVRRAGVLTRVKAGELTQLEAAAMLRLSYRQVKRLYRRFFEEGARGLVHRSAGKRSNRARPAKERKKILGLVRKHYSGVPGARFGPTLASEHLQEDHGIAVDPETLRRWMLAEGLWTRERKRKPYRQRRVRRGHFGELVQMDGSFESWLEERGPRGCLIHMVDDATSTSLATFEDEETTWGVADTLRAWVTQYGIPRALYVDWKSVYHQAPTRRQKEEGVVPISQFGRMCQKLGIELIGANSPQAKGRVERGHGTHQDRLIKKMRLKKIRSYAAANAFLADGYLSHHNDKYAVAPREATDFHLPVPRRLDLDQVFCLEEERVVSSDWVVQYGGRWLQIDEKGQKTQVGPRATVTMRQHRDGSFSMWLGRTRLRWRELAERPQKPIPAPKDRRVVRTPVARSHPWRQPFSAAQEAKGSGNRNQTPQITAG